MWEDNLWRKAWLDLKGEQGLVPIIVPLGDFEDTEVILASKTRCIMIQSRSRPSGAAMMRQAC